MPVPAYSCFPPNEAPANLASLVGAPFPAPLCFHGLCLVNDTNNLADQTCVCDDGWESDRFMFHNTNCTTCRLQRQSRNPQPD